MTKRCERASRGYLGRGYEGSDWLGGLYKGGTWELALSGVSRKPRRERKPCSRLSEQKKSIDWTVGDCGDPGEESQVSGP